MRYKLIEARKGKNLKPEDMSKKLGISTRMYYYIETADKDPSLKVANVLEDMFEVPQRELLKVNEFAKSIS